jgi:[acyl-carrier-protein] S-malonyltransferase
MQPAAAPLASAVDAAPVRDAPNPLIANVTARPLTAAAELRRELVEQVAKPVLWADGMAFLLDAGVTWFLELGPGTVLTNLIQRLAPGLAARAAGDAQTARAAVSWLAEQ